MRSLPGELELSDGREEGAAWALALRFRKEWNPRLVLGGDDGLAVAEQTPDVLARASCGRIN